MPDVFREKIDLHPGGGAARQHRRIDIIRKDPLQLKMIERRLARARTIDRCHDEVAQTRDASSAIRAPDFNALIHIRLGLPYLMRTERSTIRNALAVFATLSALRGYHNRTLGINLATCGSPVPHRKAPDAADALPSSSMSAVDAGTRLCQDRRQCVLCAGKTQRARRGQFSSQGG